jgi:hypothetical protein
MKASSPPPEARRSFELPLHAEVKVMAPGETGGAFATVVGNARGAVELMSTGRRRFYSGLRAGDPIVVRADVQDGHVLTVHARVQSCTATYLRAAYVGEPEFQQRQRQSVRVEADIAARVDWLTPGGSRREVSGRIVDISATGCQLVASEDLPEQTQVRITVRDDRLVELRGVTVRKSAREGKVSVGVRFDGLAGGDQEWLRRYLQRRVKRAVL